MLSTFVKVGKISSLSDARYCAGMMVDQLGFNLNKNEADYVSPQKFQEIIQWISGPEFIGQVVGLTWEEVIEAIESYELTHVETNQQDFIAPLLEKGLTVTYQTEINSKVEMADLVAQFSDLKNITLLVGSASSDLITDLANSSLAGNCLLQVLDDTEIDQLLKSGSFKGIALIATPEEKPGFKDYGNMMDILEKLAD